ncbi:hypothetical protein IWW36_005040, partial [Coemansia brasiliensis]
MRQVDSDSDAQRQQSQNTTQQPSQSPQCNSNDTADSNGIAAQDKTEEKPVIRYTFEELMALRDSKLVQAPENISLNTTL